MDENSVNVVPESPPISPLSSSASSLPSACEQSEGKEDLGQLDEVDEDEKMEVEDEEYTIIHETHESREEQRDGNQLLQHLRCKFNVVIDIDEMDAENVPQQQSPPTAPTSHVSAVGTSGVRTCSTGGVSPQHGQEATSHPDDPDDPFASSDHDDLVIIRQVEQLEKSLNEREAVLERTCRSPTDLIDLEMMEERQAKRKEQLATLKRLGPNQRIFPDVRPSNFHTVAFHMKPDYEPGDELVAHPQVFQSRWDPQFVPLPRDRENIRIFKIRQHKDIDPTNSDNPEGKSGPVFVEKTVWMWQRIEETLREPILTTQDISASLKHYCLVGPELRALNYAIENLMSRTERDNLFTKVLPCMQSLCLDLSGILTCPLPLLAKFSNYSISLTQKQIACLMANAFFSTFPKRLRDEFQFPTINFVELFQCLDEHDHSRLITKAQKIRCILHYFMRVTEEMPQGVVTYTRRSIRNSKAPDWENSTKKLSKIIALSEGTIEDDGVGMLQVDFANKMIGGGVLGGGAVQEEILFVTYPELLISRLFTEKLTACEALIVTGCERFSRYEGYARDFKFDGDFYDVTPYDSKGRKCSQIVAIDALYITKPSTQFHPKFLTRELNKAYVGFSSPTATSVPVATGKWGCGAFNGNAQLKAILQLMSASQAGRDVVFFTFGDVVIQREIEEMYSVIKDMTIQQLWTLLNQYHSLFCVTPNSKYSLCRFLKEFSCHPTPPLPGSSNQLHSVGDSDEKENPPSNRKLKEVTITKFYTKLYKPNSLVSNGDTEPVKAAETSKSLESTSLGLELNKNPSQVASANKMKECEDTSLSYREISAILNEDDRMKLSIAKDSEQSVIATPNEIDSEPMEDSKRLSLTDFYK